MDIRCLFSCILCLKFYFAVAESLLIPKILSQSDQSVHSVNEAHQVFYKPFLLKLMAEAGYEIGNLDATLILHRPKLSPHKEPIRSHLCELLVADPAVVNLKAKTREEVDSLGENGSIAAHTVVLLMKK